MAAVSLSQYLLKLCICSGLVVWGLGRQVGTLITTTTSVVFFLVEVLHLRVLSLLLFLAQFKWDCALRRCDCGRCMRTD